jgi:hypothetical protein
MMPEFPGEDGFDHEEREQRVEQRAVELASPSD